MESRDNAMLGIFAALMLAIVSPGALGWITLLLNAAVLLSVLIPALMRASIVR